MSNRNSNLLSTFRSTVLLIVLGVLIVLYLDMRQDGLHSELMNTVIHGGSAEARSLLEPGAYANGRMVTPGAPVARVHIWDIWIAKLLRRPVPDADPGPSDSSPLWNDRMMPRRTS